MFRSLLLLLSSMFVLFAVAGCDGETKKYPQIPIPETPETDTVAKIAVLHASPDAPKVNVRVNGDVVLGGVDYAEGSGLLSLESDTYTIAVDGLLPNEKNVTVIGPVDLSLAGGTRYVVVAANSVANIEPIIVSAPVEDVAAESLRVQVIHATASAPEVDVYVTAPDADINTTTPLGSFAYKATLGPVTVPADSYQIRVTLKDSKDVIFDSGELALTGGSDLVVAAIANVGRGSSPISLAVLDGTSVTTIVDKNTPATLRVIHNSPNAPSVDIVVNDNFAAPLVSDLNYSKFTPYVDVPADTYNVKVVATQTTNAVIDANLTLAQSSVSSVFAVNTVENIEALILSDEIRQVATEVKVRLVHGSPTAPNVDIYVTASGADINSALPAFSNVPFKAETGYVTLAEGEYQVRVTPTGTKDVVIDTGAITLNAGKIYTAIARDATADEARGTFGLILMDGFSD